MAGRAGSRLIQLAEETEHDAPAPKAASPTSEQRSAALSIALLVLQVFSQRVALWLGSHTLPLTITGIGAALWWRVLPQPSLEQLAGLGLYGAFGLLLLLIKR